MDSYDTNYSILYGFKMFFMSNMICGPWEASTLALVVYGRKEMERQARTAHKIDTEKWPFPCRVYMGM